MAPNSSSERDFRLGSEAPGSLQRLALFISRRRREMLLASGALLALTFTSQLFPRRWVAEAWVAPPGAETYEAPIERLLEAALAPEALERAATLAGVTTAASVVELFQDTRGLEARLGVRSEVRRDARGAVQGVALWAEAPRRDQAEALVGALAQELVERNRALLTLEAPQGTATPRLGEARRKLTALRTRHPGLVDAGLLVRGRELERDLATDRVQLAAWEARVGANAANVARLGEAVRREADALWRAETAAAEAPAPRPAEPAPAQPASQQPERTSRLGELEEELRRARATCTERHPEVRRLLRLIEGEQEAEARRALESPSPPAGRPVLEPVRGPATPPPGGLRLVAGEPEPTGEAPAALVQRAPSYVAWMAAQQEEAGARREVQALRTTHDARQAEQVRVQSEVASLEGARRDEAALVQEVGELERLAADTSRGDLPGPAPLSSRHARTVPLTWAPWTPAQGLLLALAMALLAGLAVDLLDRTYSRSEELGGLPVPVLGVVPHLRWR